MLETDYTQEIQRIKSSFGARCMSDEKAKILYSRVSFVDIESFRDVVDDIIGNIRTTPTIDDFIERLQSKRATVSRRDREEQWFQRNKNYKCSVCGATGYVTAWKWNEIFKYWSRCIFKCACDAGKARIDAYPVISKKILSDKLVLQEPKNIRQGPTVYDQPKML